MSKSTEKKKNYCMLCKRITYDWHWYCLIVATINVKQRPDKWTEGTQLPGGLL